jgi:DNA-binding protein H-NS
MILVWIHQLAAQHEREHQLAEMRAKIAYEKQMRALQAELETIEAASRNDVSQHEVPVDSRKTSTSSTTKRKRADQPPSTKSSDENDSSPSNSSSSEEQSVSKSGKKKRRKS